MSPMNAPASKHLKELSERSKRILLTGPIYPDGDSIGACLSLARGLKKITTATIEVAGKVSFRYSWLPDAERLIDDEEISGDYDLAIVMDGDRHRLHPKVDEAYSRAKIKGIIDHHSSTDPEGYDLVIVDENAASTCEIALQILDEWKIKLDRKLAELIYTGLIFDTAGFRHSNTTEKTHLLAARLLSTGIDHSVINAKILMERQQSGINLLGFALSKIQYLSNNRIALCCISNAELRQLKATHGDYEGIVETMLFVRGVELSCLCVERSPNLFKTSLRSRNHVDVAKLAKELSTDGGGHRRAAGVILNGEMQEIKTRIKNILIREFES